MSYIRIEKLDPTGLKHSCKTAIGRTGNVQPTNMQVQIIDEDHKRMFHVTEIWILRTRYIATKYCMPFCII
jgi:hypothetical protein